MKKYEFTGETKMFFGVTLRRIRALVSFGIVTKGELGGWLEKESNLADDGNAWVYGNARVSGNARVYGNARVSGNAWVSGDAQVYGNARVSGNAWVYGDARVCDNAHYLAIGPIGSRNDTITFTRDRQGSIFAKVGCFVGGIAEFREKVAKTHEDSPHAKAYLAAADLAEIRIDTTPVEDDNDEERLS